jgi:uncharacterized protein
MDLTLPSIESARAWYPEDPAHGFDHILRVYHLAGQLALAEGADIEIVRAAALLHDAADPALPDDPLSRTQHHHQSAGFARRILEAGGWPAERISAVEHAIRAHRFRDPSEPPQTLEAKILFDADKLDAIGATGVARAIAFAVSHGQPPYAPPSESFLRTGQTEAGEPHSAYHEYMFKLRYLEARLFTPAARTLAAARHRLMTEFFEQLAWESAPLKPDHLSGSCPKA